MWQSIINTPGCAETAHRNHGRKGFDGDDCSWSRMTPLLAARVCTQLSTTQCEYGSVHSLRLVNQPYLPMYTRIRTYSSLSLYISCRYVGRLMFGLHGGQFEMVAKQSWL